MTPLILWLMISSTLLFFDFVHLVDDSACACCNNAGNLTCAGGRVTFRTDCLCCPVCSRQTGETCDQVSLLCDTELKLICDRNATCQGIAELKSVNTTHNSTVIQWHHGNWVALFYGRDLHLRDNWTQKK
uniref:IGFBP N-terminal domain-containing protein n=1 Tax=Strigamia maritima TaxID=126957 RepID=T1JJD4_STRMM